MVEAGITLNKLPNASPVVMETSVCECTLAESYKHIVLGSTIPVSYTHLARRGGLFSASNLE